MILDYSKLMLRAYNAEADYAVRSMRPHRLTSLVDRLYKSWETIAKLGATMDILGTSIPAVTGLGGRAASLSHVGKSYVRAGGSCREKA
ncbi:DUF4041 domain-containing protein [Streptomyces goshikiensis]|uniref:DUF4041 domain-containing protein n=1 Tax=Streptomyces goshikiensis TaxID=1942 RepID=UPI00380FD092